MFQASPLTKAAAYEPVASKITPDTQPPNDMPNTEAKMTMPTRVAASAAGINERGAATARVPPSPAASRRPYARGASLSYTAAPVIPIALVHNDYVTVTPPFSASACGATFLADRSVQSVRRLPETEPRRLVVDALGDDAPLLAKSA